MPDTSAVLNRYRTLEETVIAGGFCIGCGACAALNDSPMQIQPDRFGRFQAQVTDRHKAVEGTVNVLKVCPFADYADNEDRISQRLFAHQSRSNMIGNFLSCYVGYVAEGDYRSNGSSGGLAKWILVKLLEEDLVDRVIQVTAVQPDTDQRALYRYSVMQSVRDVQSGSKAAYHPVEMSQVLNYVRNTPGRYAIMGVPCFIKAVRLLAKEDPIFGERIVFCAGIFCGHLKSFAYGELLAWQLGVAPQDLQAIDFRQKFPGRRANEKGLKVLPSPDPATGNQSRIVGELFGGGYSLGFFQYRACDFCDDVVAETADFSVGDAWLPEYVADGQGTSLIVVRHREIERIIQVNIVEQKLHLEPISVAKVIESQEGGFRHRREGLAYRLHLADRQGVWRPRKRVSPRSRHIGWRRRRIYRLRMLMSEKSHVEFHAALQQGSLQTFISGMKPLVKRYRRYNTPPLTDRIKKGLRRRLRHASRTIAAALWSQNA